jgi:hypothetical protein
LTYRTKIPKSSSTNPNIVSVKTKSASYQCELPTSLQAPGFSGCQQHLSRVYKTLSGNCHILLQMKKRALKVTASVYTGLFNSCANSPWHNDGLKRANHLRQLMFEKGYEPNPSNYHAMIKGMSTGHTVSSL